jgi:hypothetical protein
MIIRYYAARKTGYPAQIEHLLVEHFADQVVEIHRDPKRLARSFRVPRGEIGVVLLVIEDQKELQFFTRYRDLLSNGAARIIVVLSDPTAKAIRTVHRLRPSFIADLGQDLDDLGAVLEKIVYEEKNKENKPPRNQVAHQRT